MSAFCKHCLVQALLYAGTFMKSFMQALSLRTSAKKQDAKNICLDGSSSEYKLQASSVLARNTFALTHPHYFQWKHSSELLLRRPLALQAKWISKSAGCAWHSNRMCFGSKKNLVHGELNFETCRLCLAQQLVFGENWKMINLIFSITLWLYLWIKVFQDAWLPKRQQKASPNVLRWYAEILNVWYKNSPRLSGWTTLA